MATHAGVTKEEVETSRSQRWPRPSSASQRDARSRQCSRSRGLRLASGSPLQDSENDGSRFLRSAPAASQEARQASRLLRERLSLTWNRSLISVCSSFWPRSAFSASPGELCGGSGIGGRPRLRPPAQVVIAVGTGSRTIHAQALWFHFSTRPGLKCRRTLRKLDRVSAEKRWHSKEDHQPSARPIKSGPSRRNRRGLHAE